MVLFVEQYLSTYIHLIHPTATIMLPGYILSTDPRPLELHRRLNVFRNLQSASASASASALPNPARTRTINLEPVRINAVIAVYDFLVSSCRSPRELCGKTPLWWTRFTPNKLGANFAETIVTNIIHLIECCSTNLSKNSTLTRQKHIAQLGKALDTIGRLVSFVKSGRVVRVPEFESKQWTRKYNAAFNLAISRLSSRGLACASGPRRSARIISRNARTAAAAAGGS